jgi:hypothetical protein
LDLKTVFFRANHLSAVERRQSWGEISSARANASSPGLYAFLCIRGQRRETYPTYRDLGTVVERSEVEEAMPLIQIVIVLIVIGVLLWLVNLIPMQGTIKSILNAVVVICVVLWLLNVFGVLSYLPHIRVGS